jgi:hypothetical protein
MLVETHESPEVEELRQLGDQIATLAAHIEVATARLLEMIREFDARAGWADGFLSCAHWLNYRVGLSLHAAREQVRAARALGNLPLIAERAGQAVVLQGARPDPRGDARNRGATAQLRHAWHRGPR